MKRLILITLQKNPTLSCCTIRGKSPVFCTEGSMVSSPCKDVGLLEPWNVRLFKGPNSFNLNVLIWD